MPGDEACRVRKQMKDIPETLQDKMGQRMRLTVNGCAVKSPAKLVSNANTEERVSIFMYT